MRKVIRSICSLIKLNPLECCLLAWLLARSKYDFDKVLLDSRSLPLKPAEEEYEMKVFVFLLMNAYYVKEFLNEKMEPEIDQELNKQIPAFKYLYSKKFNPEKSLKTLSLSDINKIFNEWTFRTNKRTKVDYNSLVDKILYLSKSYNVSNHEDIKE